MNEDRKEPVSLVVLLYRLRHAKTDNQWLQAHRVIADRLRRMSPVDVRDNVVQFYSSTHGYDERVVQRDFDALMSEIFRMK